MDYDIYEAFEAIENELIESQMRNFRRHRAEEDKEGYKWSQWQGEQLKSLEKYRRNNAKKFGSKFSTINSKVAEMLKKAREDGNAEQEVAILEAIQNGFKVPDIVPDSITGEFFKLNDRKLDALIKATVSDLEQAETAILRRADDQYRKAIFNAQVYANTGAGTYEKAVDMACRDMLRAGLACVEYKNGAIHQLSDYAEMAIRTANKRAYLYGEGEKRKEFGITTVVVNSRQGGCSQCAKYIGKIFIDDVYSGGKKSDGNYPLLSDAIKGGLFHPRCKDSTSTYYEGITTLQKVSAEEMAEMDRREKLEEQQSYCKNQAKKNQRIATHSLDKDNQRTFQKRADAYSKKADEIGKSLKMSTHDDVLNIQENINTDVIITPEELVVIQKRLKNIGVKNFNNIENLKTAAIINPFIEQLEYLNDKYKIMFFRIDLVDMPKGDIAQVTPSNILELNVKYFNSSSEMYSIIEKLRKNNIIPKSAGIKYIATHEWGHYISQQDLRNHKSPMYVLFRRTKPKDFVCHNSYRDVYEYVADSIACKICDIPCKNAQKVLEYYLKKV